MSTAHIGSERDYSNYEDKIKSRVIQDMPTR
jgi:hypothetical protein